MFKGLKQLIYTSFSYLGSMVSGQGHMQKRNGVIVTTGQRVVHCKLHRASTCAIYHFLTQLTNALAQCYLQRASAILLTMYNALARCHFALARCYLQFTTRQRVVTNTPLRFCKSPYPNAIRKSLHFVVCKIKNYECLNYINFASEVRFPVPLCIEIE